ncbi:IF4E-domain-containing protein [Athelia psychrophila]|uniref:IF4E-domain-containing protein n=1 Tax=Athelia psychrophila TaxID=1759441 RepID=A0A166QT40_9AGAM|nr:IF4E-domain-containing protein [Fibularhizoctonia sp. CBS 109695]
MRVLCLTSPITLRKLDSRPPCPQASRPPYPPRAPASSRHFSTSLSGSGEEQPKPAHTTASADAEDASGDVHPLRWGSWFQQQRAPGHKIVNYEEGIKKIAAFSSVESFWSLWTHLEPPSSLVPTTDLLLFHSGVRRPVWEDPLSLSGGKWL